MKWQIQKNAITLSGEDWEDANALANIAVGTAIAIQNQTNQAVFFAISSAKPSAAFIGVAIPPVLSEMATVGAGENRVWIKGEGPVSIQVN